MKKALSAVTVFILLIQLTSCHAYMDISEQKEYELFQGKNHVYVLSAHTSQAGTIYFSEKVPGKLSGGEVTGIPQVLLHTFRSDSVVYKGKGYHPMPKYAMKDGVRYNVIVHDSIVLVNNTSEITHIPFSEITQMHLKTFKPVSTAILIAGLSGGATALLIVFISNSVGFSGLNLGW